MSYILVYKLVLNSVHEVTHTYTAAENWKITYKIELHKKLIEHFFFRIRICTVGLHIVRFPKNNAVRSEL